jgi:hypothetical protein
MRKTATATVYVNAPRETVLSFASDTALLAAWNNEYVGCAAAAAGVEVLDVENAFRGHEVCTGSPSATGSWVNGIQFSDPHWYFHPNLYGQQRLAARLLAFVG